MFGKNNDEINKKSKGFQRVTKTYERQLKTFFVKVFDLTETGDSIYASIRREMEDEIYEAFLSDFAQWASACKKHQGSKRFKLELIKKGKGFETEGAEYLKQFKLIQNDFVDKRMIWKQEELEKVLTKEKLQKYITAVMTKFADRTATTFQKLKT